MPKIDHLDVNGEFDIKYKRDLGNGSPMLSCPS